jgi:DNA-binding HxlR family transcriptional regulator
LYYVPDRGFSDLKSNLPGVSEKMLSQQLKELERDHLIQKKVVLLKPYRVHYNLAANGLSLTKLIDQMSEFGLNYLNEHGIDYLKDQHLYK